MDIYIYIIYVFFCCCLLAPNAQEVTTTSQKRGRQANQVTKWTRIESLNYPGTQKREPSQPALSEAEMGIDSWSSPANKRECSTAGDPDRL